MMAIDELLQKQELTIDDMAEIKQLPRYDFLRLFGDHSEIFHKQYNPEQNKFETYQFNKRLFYDTPFPRTMYVRE